MEVLRAIGGIIGGLAFLWAISAAVAFALHHWGQRWSPRSRMILAALFTGMLIMLIPLATELGGGSEAPVMIVSLAIAGVFLTAVCLPATWWVTRRLERADNRPSRKFE